MPPTRSLDSVAPKFKAKLQRMLTNLHAQGKDAFIFEALRTGPRQKFLWGFGRSYDDGRGVVTHAEDCNTTWHCFGLAVDVVSESMGWEAPESFWNAVGAAAEAEGLVWGGRWAGAQKDRPHVQWGAPMRGRPSDRARALRASGGLPAVWHEVGAA